MDILAFTELAFNQKLTLKQIEWLTSTENYVDLGDERRTYRTSTLLILAMHQAIYNDSSNILFVNGLARQNSMMVTILRILADLGIVPKLVRQHAIQLANDSIIRFQIAASGFAGMSLNLVLLDNMKYARLMFKSIIPCVNGKSGRIVGAT